MGAQRDSISIRRFRPEDGAFCHNLRREAFLRIFSDRLDAGSIGAGADAYDKHEFARLLDGMDSFVAEKGCERAGFCTIRYPEPETAEILYVYVDLHRLGEGVGSALVAHAERWISDRHPKVTSIVLDTAVPAYNQEFYEKLGYCELGPVVCRYPAGEVKAVRLVKKLKP